MKLKTGLSLLFLVVTSLGIKADTFGSGANQFELDFVNIGNPNNPADTRNGYGSVGYSFQMGMNEISVENFMKARTADARISNGNEDYWSLVWGEPPATKVTWYEAAKFCNWLTTGDAYSGAYQFDSSGSYLSIDRAGALALHNTVYVIPTENEWYKTAYYKPINDGSYSVYANGTDDTPFGNYDSSGPGRVNIAPEDQNGTSRISGNVFEWTEAKWLGDTRVVRGGGYSEGDGYTAYYAQGYWDEFDGVPDIGFRVAAIPEPSSVMLMMLGAGGLLFHRLARQRRKEEHLSRRAFEA